MKNWSLYQKVGAIITLTIASSGASSAYSIWSLKELNETIGYLTGPLSEERTLSNQLIDSQRVLTIGSQQVILETNEQKMKAILDRFLQGKKDQQDLLEKMTALSNDQDKEKIQRFRAASEEWHKIVVRSNELAAKNQNAEASKLLLEDAQPHLEKMRAALLELRDSVLEEAKHAAVVADQQDKAATRVGILATVFAALVSSLLAYLVMRSLKRSIDQIISTLSDNSAQVAAASQQIASSSEQLSQASTEQASSLQETSTSIDQLNAMVQKNTENAKRSSNVSIAGREAAEKGNETVQEMIQAIGAINESNQTIIHQINESNRQISEIVQVITEIGNKTKVINDIVFQTKLLSFNASVEAARAGEHGKGFAVVAEEVGNLAQMSGNAAREISQLLEGSIKKVESIVAETQSKVEGLVGVGKQKVETGMQVAEQCGAVLNDIVQKVTEINSRVEEIAQASIEQAKGVQEITHAVAQLDQVTQENTASSEEAASSAEELSAQAGSLKHSVQLLIEAVRGGSSADPIESDSPRNYPSNVIPMKKPARASAPLLQPQAKAPLKRAAGDSETRMPSEDDPRFREI